ncbi:MAG: glycosyltransferase family 61 protein [Pseudomonadota bacterium]
MQKATVVPRNDLLQKVDSCDALQGVNSGYTVLRQERRFPLPYAKFMGQHLHSITSGHVYRRTEFRVPEIALSKYSNVTVLPEKFILVDSETISGDSCEELVRSDDGVWFKEEDSFDFQGQKVCFPRLTSHKWSIGRNQIDYSNAIDVPIQEIEGPVLSTLAWYETNVSHWLVDIFARLWGTPFVKNKNLKVLVPSGSIPYMKETLELLGISKDQIVSVHNGYRYQFETLYNISRLASHYNFFSPEICEFYNYLPNYVEDFQRGTDDLIYISRQDTQNRPCVTELELEDKLKDRGFRVIQLTDLSIVERLSCLRGAKLVMGACGAGMAHTLFMDDKTHVMVTGAPDMHFHSNLFLNIAAQKNQSVALVGGQNIDNKNKTLDRWTLPVDDTLKQVDRFLLDL